MRRYIILGLFIVLAAGTATLLDVRSGVACTCAVQLPTLILRIDSVMIERVRQTDLSSYDSSEVEVEGVLDDFVLLIAHSQESGSTYRAYYEKR